MDMSITAQAAETIGWLYAITSALRVVAYAPQVVLVWRCVDGARSVSMLTWISSAVSHLAAAIYGVLVVADPCFTLIAVGNAVGSAAIVWVAGVRRAASRRRSAGQACRLSASKGPTALPAPALPAAGASPSRQAASTTASGMPAHWQDRGQLAAA